MFGYWRTEIWYSARATHVLHCWAIPPAPWFYFLSYYCGEWQCKCMHLYLGVWRSELMPTSSTLSIIVYLVKDTVSHCVWAHKLVSKPRSLFFPALGYGCVLPGLAFYIIRDLNPGPHMYSARTSPFRVIFSSFDFTSCGFSYPQSIHVKLSNKKSENKSFIV